jgi:acetyl esterase/lipase
MTKRKLKRFFYLILLFISLLFAVVLYFFISNKAPIIYGDIIYQVEYNSTQTLDIYYPTKQIFTTSPVLIFFHGGAWIAGRKESINFNRFNSTINTLRENGYSIISPSYTLASDTNSPFPGCITDAYDVIQWIENNASKYNFDTRNIGVFGESAGAHIAMMSAFAEADDFYSSSSTIKLRYVVDVYGPTDLKSLYEIQHSDSTDIILNKVPSYLKTHLDFSNLIFGFNPATNKEKATVYMDKYSPINYINDSIPPLLIIHGNEDQVVPIQQSEILIKKLNMLTIEYEYKIVENANHAFYGASDAQKEDVQNWISNFIVSNYNGEEN